VSAASAPFPQRRLLDIEAHALLAHCLDDHVHLRVRFIGVEDHGVAMLGPKLLPREGLNCRQDLLRWDTCWHREQELMHKLRRSLDPSGLDVSGTSVLFQIEVPILDQRLPDSFTF